MRARGAPPRVIWCEGKRAGQGGRRLQGGVGTQRKVEFSKLLFVFLCRRRRFASRAGGGKLTRLRNSSNRLEKGERQMLQQKLQRRRRLH